MLQEDVPCGSPLEGVVTALGSHFELLAQLLHQAEASDGLQALYTPLLASSAQLSRGLGESKNPGWEPTARRASPTENPGWEQRPQTAKSEIARMDGSEDPGDARPAYEHKGPEDGSKEPPPKRDSTLSKKTQDEEWAEDQRVLQGITNAETDEELIKNAPCVFCWLRGIVGNARYEVFWAALVMLNTCTMILEDEWTGIRSGNRVGVYERYGSEEYMDQWWPSAHEAFFAIDCGFCVMFTVELILSFTYDIWNWLLGFGVHFRHPFWKNTWDWLDFAIVMLSNTALVAGFGDGPMSNARFFRIFRLVRLLRLVRLVRQLDSLDPLHLMTTAIRGSLNALVFSILLLILIQTLFAMMMTQVLRYGWLSNDSSLSEDVQIQLFRYFGTYTRSMVTMFELTLANYPTVLRFLMDDIHEIFGFVVLLYKLTIGFAVVGVINGVFIQETFSVAQNDEFIMVRKRVRQMRHHKRSITRLFKAADKDGSDTLTRAELIGLLQKEYIRAYMEAMDLRCHDPNMLFTLIAGSKDEMTIDEFVVGIARLKGTARNIDVVAVLDILQQHQRRVTQDLQSLIQDIKRSHREKHSVVDIP